MKNPDLKYGNMKMIAPDGTVMCLMNEIKRNWYVSRNLATINENGHDFTLNFQPKGYGINEKLLDKEKINQCVVCGKDDFDDLSKHHIVPYRFMKFLPEELKSRNGLHIVQLCFEHHSLYNDEFEFEFEKELFQTYGIGVIHSQQLQRRNHGSNKHSILKFVGVLIKYADKIPEDRRLEMEKSISSVYPNIELSKKNLLKIFKQEKITYANAYPKKEKEIYIKKLIEAIGDYDLLFKLWRTNFIENMNPKFLPESLIRFHEENMKLSELRSKK